MKTYKTETGIEFTVDWSGHLPHGFGSCEIITTLKTKDGHVYDLEGVTSSMHNFDAVMELSRQEKYEALFELVETEVCEKLDKKFE